MKSKLANRIRSLRIHAGLSQQELADELNITSSAYSNIERGQTEITMTRLLAIAQFYNIKPMELFMNEPFIPSILRQSTSKLEQLVELNERFQAIISQMDTIKTSFHEISLRFQGKKRINY